MQSRFVPQIMNGEFFAFSAVSFVEFLLPPLLLFFALFSSYSWTVIILHNDWILRLIIILWIYSAQAAATAIFATWYKLQLEKF